MRQKKKYTHTQMDSWNDNGKTKKKNAHGNKYMIKKTKEHEGERRKRVERRKDTVARHLYRGGKTIKRRNCDAEAPRTRAVQRRGEP